MDDIKNARNLVKGSGFALAANLINGVIGFSTSLLIAKALGAEGYGEFSLTLAVFGIFMSVSSLGISSAAAKYTGEFIGQRRPAAAAGVFITSAKMTGLVFSASAILLYVFSGEIAGFFSKDIGPLLRIMAPGLLLGGAMSLLLSSFQGFQLFGCYSITEIMHNIVKLLAVALLLGAGLGALGATAGIVVGYAAAAALGMLLIFKWANLRKNEQVVKPSELILMGLPLAAAGYFMFLTTRGTTYLLGIFASSAAVGVYSAALIFGYELFVLSDSLNAAFFPVFSAVHGGGGRERFAGFFTHTLRLGSILVFPIVVYIGTFAPQIIGLFLGANYAQSAGTLRILLLMGLSYFMYSTCLSAFVAMGKAKKVLLLSTVPLASVFLIGTLVIPLYGVKGAAMTDSAAFAAAAAAAVWLIRKEVGTPLPLKGILKAALSAAGMGVFLFYMSGMAKTILAGALLSAASAVIYVSLLFILRIFEKSDAEMIEKIFIGTRAYPVVCRVCRIMRRLV